MTGKIVALLAVSLGVLAIACTGGDTITVLPSAQEAPGISVSGLGSSFGEPDVAVLSLGVDVEKRTVSEARDVASETMSAVLEALKTGGVKEEDIQTNRFSVQPRYDYRNDRQVLRGFAVSNFVTAKIRDIDTTGDVIDAALAAGGDLVQIGNLRFTIDDLSALEDEARVEAMEEARSKAETLAAAAGVTLGAPRSINEGGGVTPFQFDRFNALALDASVEFSQTPIELGELEVRVSVHVVYALLTEE